MRSHSIRIAHGASACTPAHASAPYRDS
jgi:hypothetical protein